MFWSPAAHAQSDLIITGVIDGPLTGGEPKALELYVVNDIADLSEYGVGSANNGGGSDGVEATFPNLPATAGDFIYVANDRDQFVAWFGFQPDFAVGAANISGDDAIELFRKDGGTDGDGEPTFEVVDVFGEISYDGSPSSLPWSYEDGWAYRQDGTGPDGSTFTIDNFRFSGRNALDDDADGTNATATPPFPIGSYSPTAVTPGGPIVVNTTDDELNSDGDCSLREAIQAANTDAAVDACPAGDGADTVVLSAATYALTIAGTSEDGNATGDLDILEDLAIEGNGATVSADGLGDRVFDVAAADLTVAFDALTISDGDVSALDGVSGSGGGLRTAAGVDLAVTNATFADNTASRAGGGVEADSGTLSFTDTDFTGNVTNRAPGNGGAFHITGGGTVSFSGGTVSDNVAAAEGGGFWNSATATMTVSSGLFDDNEGQGDAADNGGGGLFNDGGTLVVGDDVTISNNRATGAAGSGGGILNDGGSLTVGAATITENEANRAGGGIEDANGTVVLNGTTLTLNSTPEATAAPGNGGGLHSGGGDVTVNGGLVQANTAIEGGGLWTSGSLVVDGTTIDANVALSDDDDAFEGGGGLFNQGGAMTVRNATVSNNTADGDGGPGGAGSGGGAFNNGEGGTLTVENSTFSGNSAARAGGGIEGNGGLITLTDVDFTDNVTGDMPGNGGALHSTVGDVDATGGVVSGNVAALEGGGFWINAGFTMTVTDTEFTGNTASGDDADTGGGALFVNGGTLVMNGVTADDNVADGASGSGGAVLNDGGTLTINGGTISNNAANRAGGGVEDANGTTVLNGVTVTGNFIATAAPGNGGGLHSGGGTVTVNGGLFEDNTAVEGGGLWSNATLVVASDDDGPARVTGNTATGDMAGGGGVYAETGADVTVTGAAIDGNRATGASGSGGGILVAEGASLSMSLGTVSGNEANRAGGGVEVASGGAITLERVTLDGNSIEDANPGNGGGLHISGTGSATVSQSTVSSNTAFQGGGLWNSGSGSLDVLNSTVSGNAATDDGGGVYTIPGGDTSLESVTVARNAAGADGGGLALSTVTNATVSVNNAVVGDNTAGGSGNDCFGEFNTNGFLLVEDRGDSCVFFGGNENSIFGEDPELGPLADNGGPTLTHALGEGSPAVDAGRSALDVDQRGEPRSDDQDDLGAFELADDGGSPLVACTTSSPLSFDADGDGSPTSVMADDFSSVAGGSFMGATGEFAGVRNEGTDADIDLSTCSFVTFDPFARPEDVIFSTTAGTVRADDVFVLATDGGDQDLPADVFFDNPGAFALIEGTAAAGTPATAVFDRIVAAVVYDRDRDVFASVGGNATEAEMQTFTRTFLNVFSGRATSADGTGEVDLTVAAWPNPTRGASTVAFGLAEGGTAHVAVYDVLGREVAVAADRTFGVGRHEVALPTLAAGAYVVRVASEAGVQTVRLTVAR